MQDIPLFTTEHGAASLLLKNIPYSKEAYIKVLDSNDPSELLKECCDFCVAAGAETVFAGGHPYFEQYAKQTTVLRLCVDRNSLPVTDAALFPVQETTAEFWRGLYNEKMKKVPTAAYISSLQMQNFVKKGNCYFVHSGDTLLGIGIVCDDTIESVASVEPGAGEVVVSALAGAASADRLQLYVADTNIPAMRLYERLGFVITEQIITWCKIFPAVKEKHLTNRCE